MSCSYCAVVISLRVARAQPASTSESPLAPASRPRTPSRSQRRLPNTLMPFAHVQVLQPVGDPASRSASAVRNGACQVLPLPFAASCSDSKRVRRFSCGASARPSYKAEALPFRVPPARPACVAQASITCFATSRFRYSTSTAASTRTYPGSSAGRMPASPMRAAAKPPRGKLCRRTQIVLAHVPKVSLQLQPSDQPMLRRVECVRHENVLLAQEVTPLAKPISVGEELSSGLPQRPCPAAPPTAPRPAPASICPT